MSSTSAGSEYGTGQPDGAVRDRLVDELAGLTDVPVEVLQRTVVSVAVVHQLDSRGRCHSCHPWWRIRGLGGTCPTRELLRVAIREAHTPRWRSA